MVAVSDKCKRALVSLIRSLALFHQVVTTVTRDSVDVDVRKAYRTLSKRTHPDHGGHVQDQQRLNAAYEEWCDAAFQKTSSKQQGKNKAKGASVPVLLPTQGVEKSFWFRSQTVLLTYQGFAADLDNSLAQWACDALFCAWDTFDTRCVIVREACQRTVSLGVGIVNLGCAAP